MGGESECVCGERESVCVCELSLCERECVGVCV